MARGVPVSAHFRTIARQLAPCTPAKLHLFRFHCLTHHSSKALRVALIGSSLRPKCADLNSSDPGMTSRAGSRWQSPIDLLVAFSRSCRTA